MRIIWCVFLPALFVAAVAYAGEQRYVVATLANLREKPDVDAKVIATLPITIQVEVQQPGAGYLGSSTCYPPNPSFPPATEWVGVVVREGQHRDKQGWIAAELLAQERPTVGYLLKKFDEAPMSRYDCRRTWVERALAIDPRNTEAIKRRDSIPSAITEQLGYAASGTDLNLVKSLIKRGADVNGDVTRHPEVEATRGITPLFNAVSSGNLEIAAHLIENGARVNTVMSTGMGEDTYTPLSIAINKGHREMVALLLSNKADPNYCVTSAGGANGTPLILAMEKDDLETAKLLVASGADVNTVGCQYGGYGVMPLQVAIKNREMFNFLLAAGAKPDLKGENGVTPLMLAIQNNDRDTAAALLKAGANPNVKDSKGETALFWALEVRPKITNAQLAGVEEVRETSTVQADFVKLLLDYGADINARNKGGDSFLKVIESRQYEERDALINAYLREKKIRDKLKGKK